MNYRRVYIKDSKIFITMVTSKRHPILIENIEILRNSFKQTKQKIKFNIDAIVILPGHLHMIIKPEDIKKYPEIIKGIKAFFSKNIDETKIENYKLTKSRKDKKEKAWKRTDAGSGLDSRFNLQPIEKRLDRLSGRSNRGVKTITRR